MSAHPTPHSSSDHSRSSIWPVFNIILAALIGGFALFWGAAFFIKGAMLSSGAMKPETAAKAATTPAAAPAAPAAGAAAPAAGAAAPAAAASPAAAAAPAPAPAFSGPPAEIKIGVDASNPLAYDTKSFTVKAGQTVKLTFNNVHPVPQPHNIVIGTAGSKEKLFAAAMQMAADPNGMAKGYIPESPDILFHTKLLQPNTSETIEFTAPAAGAYPYLCTFPGHGAIMNGIMTVE
jgi:azurin